MYRVLARERLDASLAPPNWQRAGRGAGGARGWAGEGAEHMFDYGQNATEQNRTEPESESQSEPESSYSVMERERGSGRG